MYILADEIDSSTSQKGKRLVGGELLLAELVQIAQRKIPTKDRCYTLLSLTLLPGKPLMCILIMAGDFS